MPLAWAKKARRWLACIKHEGRKQHLGYFDKEQDAARAFDEAALRLRGSQAHGRQHGRQGPAWRLNFATEAQIAAAAEADAVVERTERKERQERQRKKAQKKRKKERRKAEQAAAKKAAVAVK